jgi:hypothetical protein
MRALAREEKSSTVHSIEINPVVERALSLVSAQIAAHGVTLEPRLGKDLPFVLADPLQLEQAVLNVVVNALHAVDARAEAEGAGDAEDAPRRIDLSTRYEGEMVEIRVEDTGLGLGPDAERIFDPFYTTKDPDRGTGLGLSLVHAFVTAWGGEVAAENREDGGARLCLRLPPWQSGGTTGGADEAADATRSATAR